MNNPEHELDSQTLELLVDGELSDEHRRQVLRLCDASPSQWRDVAIAFVEAQILSEELGQFSNAARLSENRPVTTENLTTVPENVRHTKPFLPSYLTTCLAVLLAVGLGFGVGVISNLYEVDDPLANNDIPHADDKYDPKVQKQDDSVFVLVQDRSTGALKPVEIPILNQEGANFGTAKYDSWIRLLEQDGFEVKRSHRLYPFELPDGRKMVLPIDGIRVNAKSYQ